MSDRNSPVIHSGRIPGSKTQSKRTRRGSSILHTIYTHYTKYYSTLCNGLIGLFLVLLILFVLFGSLGIMITKID